MKSGGLVVRQHETRVSEISICLEMSRLETSPRQRRGEISVILKLTRVF